MINNKLYTDKILTFDEIIEILDGGDFDRLIPQRESEIFEAKSKRPYDLPKKKAIREFIKDIASLANNKGGYIICGLDTEKPQNSPHDYIKDLDLVRKVDFYEEAELIGITTSNIHPRLDIKTNWYPSKKDANLGLGVIQIPEQNEDKKYFIVKVLEIDDEVTREYFGIPIRTDDVTKWLTVQELHKLFKRSPNSFQELHQSLTNQIDEVKEIISTIPVIPSINIDSIQAKIEETIYGTNNTYIAPLIVIGAEPNEKITLENFFSEENNPLYNLLKNPPYLRYSGWNLLTLDRPKIKDGKCWEVKNGDRKTIRFYRDGALVAIAYADDSFLGWGQDHDKFLQFPQLNSLAIIEFIYEFVELYRKMLGHLPKINKIKFKVGIKNANTWEGKKLYLRPYEVGALSYRSDFNDSSTTALTNDFYESIDVDISSDSIYDSRYIAYKILSEFFVHFGISRDKIPYTKRNDRGVGYVDTEKIVANK